MFAVTVAPEMAARPVPMIRTCPPTFRVIADSAVCVSVFRTSSKVTATFLPFTVAEANRGRVVSAGVALVTALSVKFATAFLPLSASWSLFPVAGAA